VGDTVVELDESFTLSVPGASGMVTINNDDAATLTIADATPVLETDAGTTQLVFDVTLDNAVDVPLTVDYATADDTATTADSDYTAMTGSLNFTGAAGQTLQISVDVTGDCIPEADEVLRVGLSNLLASGRESAITVTGGGGGSGGTQSVSTNVPEANGYTLVYDLAIPNTLNFQTNVPYTTNNSGSIANGSFDRIAYYLELDSGSGLQYVYVSVDAFTPNAALIGVPSFAGSNTVTQQLLANMNVVSNKPGIVTGTGIATGNIEFWPFNYGTENIAGVPGANVGNYDFGDRHLGSSSYGSMQIHNYAAGQTLFALNNFQSNSPGEMGIGNATSGSNPDWTFTNNGGSYTVKNLQILVRNRGAAGTILNDDFVPQVTVAGIADTTILTSSPQATVALFPVFEDTDDADTALIYAVTSNSNPALIQTSAINSVDGLLVLDTPCTLIGTANITVRATDLCGLWVEDTFTVEVLDNVPPVINCAGDIVINAPAGGSATADFSIITAWDKVDASPSLVFSPDDSAPFAIGSHPITATATDASGNITVVIFEVHVLEIQPSGAERVMDILSLRNDAAPDAGGAAGVPAGATILAHNRAYLNNNGDIIYEASLLGAGTNNNAVFKQSAGSDSAIAVRNTAAPGGGIFSAFSNLAISDSGASIFQSSVSAKVGQFVENAGTVTNPARAAQSAPGTPGEFIVLQKPAVSSSGELLTPASRRINVGGVTASDDTGLWRSAGGGALIAREGSPSPIAATNYGQFHPRLVGSNANDRIAYAAFLLETVFDPTDNTALFAGTLGSAPSVVVREGDPAPGEAGVTFSQFLGETVNSNGDVAFRGAVFGTGINVQNSEGIWTNVGGTLRAVARENGVAPCLPTSGVVFSRFTTVFIGDDGVICFHAFLKNAAGSFGVHSGNDGSIWSYDPATGHLHMIAREGDLANSTDGAVYLTLGAFDCSSTQGVVFHSSLVTGIGAVTSTTNQGVWLDQGVPDAAPKLVLLEGDTFDIDGQAHTVTNITLDAQSNAGGGTGGYGRAINDSGEILLKLSLTLNRSGLFKISMP
jgi:hypothetical protein